MAQGDSERRRDDLALAGAGSRETCRRVQECVLTVVGSHCWRVGEGGVRVGGRWTFSSGEVEEG